LLPAWACGYGQVWCPEARRFVRADVAAASTVGEVATAAARELSLPANCVGLADLTGDPATYGGGGGGDGAAGEQYRTLPPAASAAETNLFDRRSTLKLQLQSTPGCSPALPRLSAFKEAAPKEAAPKKTAPKEV